MSRTDKQGRAIEHRELQSICCNQPQRERKYMCHSHFAEEQKLNATLQMNCTSIKKFKKRNYKGLKHQRKKIQKQNT